MTARIALFGARGRMGRAIRSVSIDHDGIEIVAAVDDGDPLPDSSPDVIVDFTSPNGARRALAAAVSSKAAFVSGTTGTDPDFERALDAAATTVPVLHAANMSLGVAVLRHLASAASAALPWDTEIIEVHHRRKKDAPSGTAYALLEAVNAGRDRAAHAGARTERSGMVGARTDGEVGVFGVRGGDVVGEHTVFYFGEGERIELTHRATDRAIFARGAVTAATWIADRPAGRYTIEDVLGLTGPSTPASAS